MPTVVLVSQLLLTMSIAPPYDSRTINTGDREEKMLENSLALAVVAALPSNVVPEMIIDIAH